MTGGDLHGNDSTGGGRCMGIFLPAGMFVSNTGPNSTIQTLKIYSIVFIACSNIYTLDLQKICLLGELVSSDACVKLLGVIDHFLSLSYSILKLFNIS